MPVRITLQGTLRKDGRLELDDRVLMPEGRVWVTVQPIEELPPDNSYRQTMERIRADQKARGYVPRTKEEIDAGLQEMDDDAEAEMQAIERFHQECRLSREQAEKSQKES